MWRLIRDGENELRSLGVSKLDVTAPPQLTPARPSVAVTSPYSTSMWLEDRLRVIAKVFEPVAKYSGTPSQTTVKSLLLS